MARFNKFLGTIKGKIFFILVTLLLISGAFGTGTFYPNAHIKEKLVYKIESLILDRASDLGLHEPDFKYNSPESFTQAVSDCVDYLNFTVHHDKRIPKGLIIAMAGIESGWGTSRFAKEGNNLFGIRTYDLKEPHMLPSNNPKKWGVKVYMHECDSVLNYINVLNNGSAFKEYRQMREDGITDPFLLTETLDAYASDKDYFSKVKSILSKIRKDYQ